MKLCSAHLPHSHTSGHWRQETHPEYSPQMHMHSTVQTQSLGWQAEDMTNV